MDTRAILRVDMGFDTRTITKDAYELQAMLWIPGPY